MSFAEELKLALARGHTLQYRQTIRVNQNRSAFMEDPISWKRTNGQRPFALQDLWCGRSYSLRVSGPN